VVGTPYWMAPEVSISSWVYIFLVSCWLLVSLSKRPGQISDSCI
jgi:hypothetical protein